MTRELPKIFCHAVNSYPFIIGELIKDLSVHFKKYKSINHLNTLIKSQYNSSKTNKIIRREFISLAERGNVYDKVDIYANLWRDKGSLFYSNRHR